VDTRLVILIAASALLVVSIAYFVESLFASARARRASDAGPETVPVPTSGADKAREAMLIPVDVQGWEPWPASDGQVALGSPAPESLAVSAGPHDLSTGDPPADGTAAGLFDEPEAVADELDERLVELAAASAEAPSVVAEPPAPAPGPEATVREAEGLLPLEATAPPPPAQPVDGDQVRPEGLPHVPVRMERADPETVPPVDVYNPAALEPVTGSPSSVTADAAPTEDLLAELRESLAGSDLPEPLAEPRGLLAWEPSPPPPIEPVAYEPPAPVAYEPPAPVAYEPPAPVAYEPPDYDMVAPVELMFTDGPKRIGIRPGTATFLKYQRLAAVLLGDLKKARAGGS
jgi:hypothetical protein